MKKLIFILSVIMFASPAFSQGSEVMGIIREGVALTEQVGWQVAKAGLDSRLIFPLEFINLPQSLADVPAATGQLIVNLDEAQQLGIMPEATIVKAEFFPSRELSRRMKEFDDLELYGTVGLRGPAFYRGMVLPDLPSLKNVLTKGLEWKKTSYNRIFASRYLSVALDNAYVNPGNLPVLVLIADTDKLLFSNVIDTDMQDVAFGRDISADMLNVMAFLKINGKPGWYDVRLQDDQLIFSRGPRSTQEIHKE